MSSEFSRKMTMSVFSGSFTGEGTPLNQRTGRRHTYRSSSWRSATLIERIPPPTGVVRGPLIETTYSRDASSVSSGSQTFSPYTLQDFSPAYISIHTIAFFPPYAFFTAASTTLTITGVMSTPVPSPSMNGMTGWSGTFSEKSLLTEIFVPLEGTLMCLYAMEELREVMRFGEGELYKSEPAASGRAAV